MNASDNPAARVAALLERIRIADPHQGALGAGLKVFELPERRHLPWAMAEIIKQLDSAREAVRSLPEETENPDFLLKHFPVVEKLFNDLVVIGFNVPMQHFMQT